MQERFEEAVEPLRLATKRGGDAETLTLLARALAQSGRRDEALAALRDAVDRRPVFPFAFLELADQLARTGGLTEAISVLERGTALAPGALDLKVALGYLHLNRGETGSARAWFMQVRAAAPQRGDAILGFAHVAAAQGDHRTAVDLFRHILDHRPDDAATRMSLAKSLLAMGDRAGGETALRIATRFGAQGVAEAIRVLAEARSGRVFLQLSAAEAFLRGAPA